MKQWPNEAPTGVWFPSDGGPGCFDRAGRVWTATVVADIISQPKCVTSPWYGDNLAEEVIALDRESDARCGPQRAALDTSVLTSSFTGVCGG